MRVVLSQKKGASLIEYTTLLGFLSVALLGTASLFGLSVADVFARSNDGLALAEFPGQSGGGEGEGSGEPPIVAPVPEFPEDLGDPMVLVFSGTTGGFQAAGAIELARSPSGLVAQNPDSYSDLFAGDWQWLEGGEPVIDWGPDAVNCPDKLSPMVTTYTCTFSSAGPHRVSVDPVVAYFSANYGDAAGFLQHNLQSVETWGETPLRYLDSAFGGASLVSLPDSLPSSVVSLYQTFSFALSIPGNITNWDVSNVKDMRNLFKGQGTAPEHAVIPDITGWRPSSVASFNSTFLNATFDQEIGSWTVGSGADFQDMFKGSTFNQDIGSWDMGSVDRTWGMFQNTAFNQDISGWNMSSNTDTRFMFAGNAAFNQDISGWDMSGVRNISNMFDGATAFNQPIGENWNVPQVNIAVSAFRSTPALTSDFSAWRPSMGSASNFARMFEDSSAVGDLRAWDASLIGEPSRFSQNAPGILPPLWGQAPQ